MRDEDIVCALLKDRGCLCIGWCSDPKISFVFSKIIYAKCYRVYEGDPIVLMGDPMNNADFTHEYFYAEKYGVGIVLAGGNAGIGKYEMTDGTT